MLELRNSVFLFVRMAELISSQSTYLQETSRDRSCWNMLIGETDGSQSAVGSLSRR